MSARKHNHVIRSFELNNVHRVPLVIPEGLLTRDDGLSLLGNLTTKRCFLPDPEFLGVSKITVEFTDGKYFLNYINHNDVPEKTHAFNSVDDLVNLRTAAPALT